MLLCNAAETLRAPQRSLTVPAADAFEFLKLEAHGALHQVVHEGTDNGLVARRAAETLLEPGLAGALDGRSDGGACSTYGLVAMRCVSEVMMRFAVRSSRRFALRW